MIEGYGRDEIRQRKIVRRILIVTIFLLIAMIGVKVIDGLQVFTIFPVKKVQINGTHFVKNKEIVGLMGLTTATSLISLSKKRARDALLEDKRIKRVVIVKLYPDTVRIWIEEKPKSAFLRVGTEGYWTSLDGTILGKASEDELSGYPAIILNTNNDDIKIGQELENFLVKDLLLSIDITRKRHPDFFRLIDLVTVEENGAYISLENGFFSVYMGKNVTIESFRKLRTLITVLESKDFGKSGLIDGYDIDMSFSHAAVKEREKKDVS